MDGLGRFFLIVFIVFIAMGFIRCIRIVPQAQCWITEFFGKYKASWGPGLHIKIPFCERVVSKVSLKERALDFKPQGVITKDNVVMMIDSVVFMQVTDAKLYTYGIENPVLAVENLTSTTLRNIVGTLDFDTSLSSRDRINTEMTEILDEATDPWGIKIRRVEIKGIQPPEDIREAMTKQMKAERERRQTILEAEAHQKSVVTRAEGDKTAKILAAEAERDAQIARAEGEAKSIRLVYEAEAEGLNMLKSVSPSQAVLQLKGMEALKSVADGNATKIFMPSDITQLVTMNGLISESMGIGDATPVKSKPKAYTPNIDACCDDIEKSKTTREIVHNNMQ